MFVFVFNDYSELVKKNCDAVLRNASCKKLKVKFTPEQATKFKKESRRIALLFLQPRPSLGRFTLSKDPVPIVQEAG